MLLCLSSSVEAENYPYRSDYLWLIVPNHADWLYKTGEKAKVEDKTYEHHVKVGFSPEQLKPYTKDPDDFDAFWKQNLEEARKTPVSVDCKKVEKYSTDDFDCYLLKIRTDRRHSIYGYLTKPKAYGKYPVVLCPPGAGIKTIKEPMSKKTC